MAVDAHASQPEPREHATVTWIGDGFVHAVNDFGTTYFVFHNAIQQTSDFRYEDLWIGSRIELTPIAHPKGWRGIEVRILSV